MLVQLERGGALRREEVHGLVRLDLALPTSPDGWPDTTVGRALRAVARGHPQAVIDHWTHSERGGSPDLVAWLDAVEASSALGDAPPRPSRDQASSAESQKKAASASPSAVAGGPPCESSAMMACQFAVGRSWASSEFTPKVIRFSSR